MFKSRGIVHCYTGLEKNLGGGFGQLAGKILHLLLMGAVGSGLWAWRYTWGDFVLGALEIASVANLLCKCTSWSHQNTSKNLRNNAARNAR